MFELVQPVKHVSYILADHGRGFAVEQDVRIEKNPHDVGKKHSTSEMFRQDVDSQILISAVSYDMTAQSAARAMVRILKRCIAAIGPQHLTPQLCWYS